MFFTSSTITFAFCMLSTSVCRANLEQQVTLGVSFHPHEPSTYTRICHLEKRVPSYLPSFIQLPNKMIRPINLAECGGGRGLDKGLGVNGRIHYPDL